MDMVFRHFSVCWSCCRSARAPTWSTPSSTMWNTQVLGRASLEEQNLAPESGRFSLSLQVPPQVSMRKLDSFAEHVVQVRVYLIVWQSARLEFLELACNMAASDSESSMSGVDVTITAVHPSPFRDPTTGDEFDGQEISFEAPESRDIQAFLDSQRSPTTPGSSSSDAEVPEFTLPASSTDFQNPIPAKKRQQLSSAEYHPHLRHQVPSAVKQGTRHPEAPVLTGWKWAVL